MATDRPRRPASTASFQNISGSAIVVGDKNKVHATIHFEKFKDSGEGLDPGVWENVAKGMDELRKAIRELGDEHEKIRDVQLMPAATLAKGEATEIAADPAKSKKTFLEKFKDISEVSSKVVEVGAKLAPFIAVVGKLLGIA